LNHILQKRILLKGGTGVINNFWPIFKTGYILLPSVPALVTAATKSMLFEFIKESWIETSAQLLAKVHRGLDKCETEELMPTLGTVLNKLGQSLPPVFCNTCLDMELDPGPVDFSTADRLAANGNHLRVASVSKSPYAKIADNVLGKGGPFTIGSTSLQCLHLTQDGMNKVAVMMGLDLTVSRYSL